MKKVLSLLVVGALVCQSQGVSAMSYVRRGKDAVQAQGAKAAAFAGPFLSEVGAAIKSGNVKALPGIMQKYKRQSAAAGAIAAGLVAAVGLAVRAMLATPSVEALASQYEFDSTFGNNNKIVAAAMEFGKTGKTIAIERALITLKNNPDQVTRGAIQAAMNLTRRNPRYVAEFQAFLANAPLGVPIPEL